MLQFSGLSEGRILSLSFEQFRSLFATCERLDANEKRLNAWTMMVATQATDKTMQKWAKRWDSIIEGMDNDAEKLAARFGKGV